MPQALTCMKSAPHSPIPPGIWTGWTKKSRSTLEMNDPACRPAIEGQVKGMEQYDTILIGFPIWWYVEPRIVDTFLDSYDFSGKTLIPFATSGGSGISKAQKSLQEHCPAANWKQGQLLNGSSAAGWAKNILNG